MTAAFSLRRKVRLTLFGASGLALVITALALGIFEYRSSVTRARLSLESLADTLAFSLVASLDFNSPDVAAQHLARLEPSGAILAAAVFRPDAGKGDRAFATYRRAGADLRFPLEPRPAGFYRDGDHALLVHPLRSDGSTVALLLLEADISVFRRGFNQSLELLGLIFLVLAAASLVISGMLQSAVTRPIVELARTAERIHSEGNYTLRAGVSSRDEIGQLAANFNEMLVGIARRDRELAAHAAFQQAVFENTGVSIISTGPDGTIRTVNAAAERMLGYDREELVGRTTPVILHDQAELAQQAADLSRRLRRPVTPDFQVFAELTREGSSAAEWLYVRKDGSRFPVFLVISTLRTATGEMLGLCGIATDLTERKRAEDAVRASEARFRIVAEQTGQLIFDQDLAKNRRVWAGAAQSIVGYAVEELNAAPPGWWTDRVHADDQAAFRTQHDDLRQNGGTRQFVYRFQRRDNRWIYLTGIVTAVADASGRPVRLLGTIADVTAQQEAADAVRRLNTELDQRVRDRTFELGQRVGEVEALNEELRASQRAADRAAARLQEVNASLHVANQELEAFSYSVSHDLRAPLRNITGFIELLRKRLAPSLDADSGRFLGIVTSEAARMGALIDDLLTFSRVGRTQMKIEEVSFEELIEEVRREFGPDLEGRAVAWRIQSMPRVRGDRALLRQVVANLIGNAIKFTRRRNPAVVEMGLQPPGPADTVWTFFVRDNGAGFNPQYLDKLFRVFQRLHNAREFEGTGIGLANVKRIITRHGGRVWADGKVDSGATFYFTLRKL